MREAWQQLDTEVPRRPEFPHRSLGFPPPELGEVGSAGSGGVRGFSLVQRCVRLEQLAQAASGKPPPFVKNNVAS